MEHSALHALQLTGLVLALGGPLLVLGLLRPVCRALGPDPARDRLAAALEVQVVRWVCGGALVAGLSTISDLFVQTAELRQRTVFGGVDLALLWRFATQTTVGQLAVARAGLLLAAAGAIRLPDRIRWRLTGVLAGTAVVAASLVSHAAAQPTGRDVAVVAQVLHIAGVGAWMGVLVHLLVGRRLIEGATAPGAAALVAGVVGRFSPVALVAVGAIFVSGLYGAVRYVGTPTELVASAYGLTLTVKMILLLGVLYAGAINFRVVRPALLQLAAAARLAPLRGGAPTVSPSLPVGAVETDAAAGRTRDATSAASTLRLFGRMLELEVTAGVVMIAVAGILGSISPPGDDGTARLTPVQLAAVWSPHLPSPEFVDPATFIDEADRTLNDLRYGEFMHNWAGVFVTFMGLFWLMQSVGGVPGAVATRLWPFLLVPFAAFISAFADPEVFVLGRVTFREAIGDSTVVEHQLGAVMLLIMVWLGRRDAMRPPEQRPMGPALPIVMMFGSFLLLGHAHSSLGATDELTTLINVQHAVLGGGGLLAGAVRWFTLRDLFPRRLGNLLWPSLITAIGLFMALCYREVT